MGAQKPCQPDRDHSGCREDQESSTVPKVSEKILGYWNVGAYPQYIIEDNSNAEIIVFFDL